MQICTGHLQGSTFRDPRSSTHDYDKHLRRVLGASLAEDGSQSQRVKKSTMRLFPFLVARLWLKIHRSSISGRPKELPCSFFWDSFLCPFGANLAVLWHHPFQIKSMQYVAYIRVLFCRKCWTKLWVKFVPNSFKTVE